MTASRATNRSSNTRSKAKRPNRPTRTQILSRPADHAAANHAPSLRIVSGGQTGADRAALDWAMRRRVRYGGWCPKGRLAEDGVIDPRYRLRETPSASYAERTEWNIRDTDGTVIISMKEGLVGGSLLTVNIARRLKKPLLHLCQSLHSADAAARLKAFIAKKKIQVLNVAGPRASEEPALARFVEQVLGDALDGAPERR